MEAGRTLSPNANQDPPRKIYSLSQLGESLKRTLEQVTHGRELWFKAEIAKLTTSPSGHMYLELVEEAEGVRLASMRGTLWKSQRAKVLESLGESAQHVLSPGTEMQVNSPRPAPCTFHEQTKTCGTLIPGCR